MSDNPIWITGLGILTSLGNNFADFSANLLAGKNGIRPVTGFDVSQHPCQIGGQVDMPPCPAEFDAAVYDSMLPLEKTVVFCCINALRDAGLWQERGKLRIGLLLGAGGEWLLHWDFDIRRGNFAVFDSSVVEKSAAEKAFELLQLSGPQLSVAAACASGNHAFAQALTWLQMGWVDVCIAGAADIGITALSLAAFGNLRALSRRNDTPATALRPFDRDRDGMVLGEGGCLFVLERAEQARRRSREPYAELAGVGTTSDAYHLVTPSPDPSQAIAAIRQGLAAAKLNPEDVDYVNAHATGTQVGDTIEAKMLQAVFGAHCRRIPVSSTKSMTGHLLSAAAAVEATACLTAMKYGAIPPTLNLDHPDPECDLCHVANVPREARVRVAISNSFGFGGHNTSLVLKAA
ncbi:MAG TPA: beta-ketoacyl-[acyl-carrier-protein] synthase family protein [Pirellulales bacterium]|jgi:3-oxoacyl-[acyl-carrier-protein] synthase II|nr:beta-ketoacyl-[acyl-carrier-protein] synthase family protein [Pirellulales bacterium]